MTSPVTGPFSTSINQNASHVRYVAKTWYRQKKPYNQVLTYDLQSAVRKSVVYTLTAGSPINAISYASGYSPRAYALNLCYERLKGKLGDQASLGVMLAEFGESAHMVINRATQLLRFARALKRLDFGSAARELKMAAVPSGVSRHKSFANNWLEYWFGWAPAVGDISNAVSVLGSQPLLPKRISASAWLPFSDFGQFGGPGTGYYYASNAINGKTYCKQGCLVTVTNRNLALLNQLGLANPLVIAYEVIPFSFLLNWVINVEQMLSLGTDFLGLAVTDSYTTYFTKADATYVNDGYQYPIYAKEVYAVTLHERRIGLVKPTLTIRPWRNLAWTRAATAISLLAQQLRH